MSSAMLHAGAQRGAAALPAAAQQQACSSVALPRFSGISGGNVWRQGGVDRRRRRAPAVAAAVEQAALAVTPPAADANQHSREGAHEAPLVVAQATKEDAEQAPLASVLLPFDPTATADVAVVGAGPAGLVLAAELAAQGLSVALVSPESKFVNNYGVWLDEFKELGLEHTLDAGAVAGSARLVGRRAPPALRTVLVPPATASTHLPCLPPRLAPPSQQCGTTLSATSRISSW